MDTLIRYILYISFFISIGIIIYLLIRPQFAYLQKVFERIKNKNNFQMILQRTRDFLERSIGKNSLLAAYTFLGSIMFVFVFCFLSFSLNGNNIFMALFYSVFLVVVVVGIFFMLAYRNQVLVTHEGLFLIEEIINNYKIYHSNIIEAIEQTSNSLSELNAPLSRKMMKNLSYRVKNARNDEMVRIALKQLVNSIGVSWSYSLSSVFEKAIIEGVDIGQALKDIKIQLEDLEQLKESLKDEVHEAKSMLYYMTPFMVVLTVVITTNAFDISLLELMQYQFGQGITYLFLIVIMISFSLGYYLLITKPKNDY